MGVNTTDVDAMNRKLLLPVIVISATLLIMKQRRKIMATTPKTFKVLLKDGSEGRAVRLTARNNLTILNWIPGAEHRESVSKTGQSSNQRIMLPVNGSKAIRAAYYDDWIVKTGKGFQVVKFDKTEQTLFFIDADASEAATKRAFTRWVKELA
jgi:hypothetical protein